MAAGSAVAAPEDPVRNIMDLATRVWSEKAAPDEDYFDTTRLGTLYSKTFADAYREAAKFPIYEEGGSPFGYDVITNGQDGCPLKDVNVEPAVTKGTVSDVKVTFKLWACVEDGSIDKNMVSELHFDVITENGKDVIADIHRVVEGKQDSLLKEMQDHAASGKQE